MAMVMVIAMVMSLVILNNDGNVINHDDDSGDHKE